ncbi:hypothetical protein CKO35_04440 [Ectothiorhodospira shaposhnikovii]|uniref:DUF721 domain-containing protein n=1 Tax=Ectothiorhodospira shaposhnikovii TaxID=1054 RepID=UPI0019072722|nr:DUF721 domain-containing protein [Ectothiorhodospira shaposhnikovii]MBK1672558.1 hypothetical protein [Ectothiorhodospira shaposhnikovii]
MRRPRVLLDPALLTRARMLENLTWSVRNLLPPGPREHCWVSGMEDGALTLVTDSGAWATQLRYLKREILKQIQAHHGLHPRSIQIRVCPALSDARKENRPRQANALSNRARESLLSAANTVEDTELRQALRRLAARSKTSLRQ